MYGFPKRINRQRRILPTTTLFDPSGDSSCTGWWRADSGLTVSDANRQLVNSWTSKLPSGLVLVGAGAPSWLNIPALTNGFPGIMGWSNENWNTAGVAENGDRSFTYTFVLRTIRFYTVNTWLIGLDNMMGVGYWDGYLRPLHPYISWWNCMDGAYYPNGNASVLVASVRMQPYDQAGGDLRGKWKFTYGTNFYGPFTQDGGWGDRVLSESNSLRIYGYAGGHQVWHEVITFRRYLSDTEILDMHTALLAQYGAM